MAQHTLPVIAPAVDTGTELSGWLNDWATAINSGHSGTARPSYAQPGLIWFKTSDTTFRAWNGTAEYSVVGADSNGDISGYRSISINGNLTTSGVGHVNSNAGYYFGDTSKGYVYAQMPDGSAGDEEVVIRTGTSPNNKFFKFTPNGYLDLTSGGGQITSQGITKFGFSTDGSTSIHTQTGYCAVETPATTNNLRLNYAGNAGADWIANAGEVRYTSVQSQPQTWFLGGALSARLDRETFGVAYLSCEGFRGYRGGSFYGPERFSWFYSAISPHAVLNVVSGGVESFYNFGANGNASAPGAWIPASDARLKTNAATLTGALATVSALTGKSYERNGVPKVGLIAQEVQTVVPEAVVEIGEVEGVPDALGVDYMGLVAVLVEAIKELASANTALAARVSVLEN